MGTLCHFVIELGFEPKTYCLEGDRAVLYRIVCLFVID